MVTSFGLTVAGRVARQGARVVQHGVEDTDAPAEESFRPSGIFLVEFFPMPEGASPVYRFGPFVLDVADRSLKRDGVAIPLTPKQFDLLVALVTNAGRLVEKDTLLKSVWPDVAVEEGNLTKGIFSLRQLLEQEGVRYIETVPKRGYRFAATVTREASTVLRSRRRPRQRRLFRPSPHRLCSRTPSPSCRSPI